MLDINYISSICQDIVDREFSTSVEKKIVNQGDRLNLRCPYCHEGKTKTKKRGNLYLNKMLYVCFRCGKKTNFDRFIKDFNIIIDAEKKLELIEYLNNQISYQDIEDDIFDHKFDKLLNLADIERIFNDGNHVITDFKNITINGKVHQYLLSRGITENLQSNIFEGKYWTSLLDHKVEQLKKENIAPIITDVRYIEYKEDEYSWIKSHDGILIHLSRKLDDGSLVPPANIEEKSNDNKLKAVADFAICWETCQDTNFLYELIQKNLRNIYDRLTANSKD